MIPEKYLNLIIPYKKIIISIVFLLFGFIFFVFNPYNILDYVYLPFVIFFIMFGVFSFFYMGEEIYVTDFLYKVLYFTSIFLVLAIIYFLLKNILLYTINISFGAMFLFYLVTFALIYNLFFNNEFENSKSDNFFQVIKYFVFYIPCILISVVNYFINDAKQTNKTTYILGLMLVLLIVIYFIIPIITKYTRNDLLLIDEKEYLNKSILTMTLKEIKENLKKGSFYKEGFNSLSEVNLLGQLPNFEKKIDLSLEEIIDKYKDKPELMNQYIQDEMNKSIIHKLYYYIKFNFLTDNKESTSEIYHTYHYGISFKLYLNSDILSEKNRDKALILSLGSRPSLYYDYNTRELIIEITDVVSNKTFKQTRIYNSSKILFQKWNHIVMNYVNGQFDLFVNNEIVSTQSNVSPYINDLEVLQVGSVENSDIGAISELIYYDQPLSLYKINNKINN